MLTVAGTVLELIKIAPDSLLIRVKTYTEPKFRAKIGCFYKSELIKTTFSYSFYKSNI
jgi:hypothetical protein